ncbi:MAG: coenzyme F420-0:L-glutamate ligase [Candidatus Methanomethylicia archaeon]
MARALRIIGLETIPNIKPGDDIADLIVKSCIQEGINIDDGDVIVVAQKIVSKAEGRILDINSLRPSDEALKLSEVTGKDARFIEAVLMESREVVKASPGHLITITRHGITCANAGIDRSNVSGLENIVTLLPINPDVSAEKIRRKIKVLTGRNVAVVISDTYGRPLRNGQINVAIGLSGINPFKDYRGMKDLAGYTLHIKNIALADEIASAAELVMGQAQEKIPVAIVKGLKIKIENNHTAEKLNMDKEKWLFK